MTMKTKQKLNEEALKKLVALVVDKKMEMLQEGTKFNAIRSLTIQAQQTALEFEAEIIKALNLKDPDDLSDVEQSVFATAMADMHAKMVEAVVQASRTVKDLSERPAEEKDKKSNKGGREATVASSGNTVHSSLPTL